MTLSRGVADPGVHRWRSMPLAVEAGDEVWLIRLGLPADAEPARIELEAELAERGLHLVDPESNEARHYANQATGLAHARWAVWASSYEAAEAVLTSGPSRRRMGLLVAAGVVAVGLAAGASSFAILRHHSSAPRTSVAASRLTPFVDRRDGIAVGMPATWSRLRPAPRGAAMLAASRDGSASMLLRSVPLQHSIDPANAAAVRDVVTTVIDTSKAQVLAQRQVTFDGMPGVLYVYTFRDPATGNLALHWHYFLFDGRRLQMLVLQVTPATGYGAVAATFDAIAGSIRAA
jgi:hypothetical protein